MSPIQNIPRNGITGDTRSPLQTIHKYIPNINKPESATWAAQGRPYMGNSAYLSWTYIFYISCLSKLAQKNIFTPQAFYLLVFGGENNLFFLNLWYNRHIIIFGKKGCFEKKYWKHSWYWPKDKGIGGGHQEVYWPNGWVLPQGAFFFGISKV